MLQLLKLLSMWVTMETHNQHTGVCILLKLFLVFMLFNFLLHHRLDSKNTTHTKRKLEISTKKNIHVLNISASFCLGIRYYQSMQMQPYNKTGYLNTDLLFLLSTKPCCYIYKRFNVKQKGG